MAQEKTTIENIHVQRRKKNILTALIAVLLFGGFAVASIAYNIMVRG